MGGGGGSSRTPREAPNTLRAKQTLKLVYLVSQGPCAGPITPENVGKSILLGGTPVIAEDGSVNYQGVTWDWRDGAPGQTAYPGIPSQESLITVGQQVTVAAGPVVRSIDLANAHRFKILITIPALYEINPDSGDQNPTTVGWRLSYRIGAGSWITLQETSIREKCVAPYSREIIFDAPTQGVIDVRMERLTPDSTSTYLANGLAWSSYSVIVDRQLSYPGSATVMLELDAEQYGSQLPDVAFRWRGLLCWVPTNYDPVARTYATSGAGTSGGVWDGTFKRAWTNNPAWMFWTLATDPDVGCGDEIGQQANKWYLYEIAQYADQLVPDGFGGMEPRYTFNAWISSRDEALRVLQVIASAFRGMVYWSAGEIVVRADRPSAPVKLVTKANVVDGRFEYTGVSQRARHNVVKVRWRDPAQLYQQTIEVVQDPTLIAEVGFIREVEIDGVGITSRGLARRFARWILYTERFETETVSYRAFRDHADITPGDIILVSDPSATGIEAAGRLLEGVAEGSPSVLRLDRPFPFVGPDASYRLRVVLADGALSAEINVLSHEDDTVTLASPLPAGNLPVAGAVWMVLINAAAHYRVVARTEDDKEISTVTALKYFPGKFDFIETGAPLEDEAYSQPQPTGPLPPPTGLVAQEYLTGVAGTPLVRVTFSWAPPLDSRITGYEAQVLQGATAVALLETSSNTVVFEDLTPNTYTLRVRSVGLYGQRSAWAILANVAVDGQADPPAAPAGVSIASGIRTITLSWGRPAAVFLRGVEIWAAGLGFNNASFNPTESLPPPPADAAFSKLAEIDGTSFVHTGLQTSHVWYYRLRAVDVFGTPGDWVGPIGARTSYLIAADIQDGILNTAKFAQNISPVGLITAGPVPTLKQEDVIFHGPSNQLYRWDTATAAYVRMVRAVDLDGLIADAQISGLDASKLSGVVSGAIIDGLAASKITGQLTNEQIAALDAAKLTGTVAEARLATLDAAKLTGTINEARIAALAASKITGTLTNTQIADLDAAKLSGQVVSSQIAAAAITASKLVLTDTSNVYPDFDMLDPAFYASSTGASYSFFGSSNNPIGLRRISIAASAETHAVESGWFPVEVTAEHLVEGAAWLGGSTGSNTATLEIEFGSMAANGVITPTRRVLVGSRTDVSSSARHQAFITTGAAERRARFVMTKTGAGSRTGEFAGFLVRRRSSTALIVDGAITASKLVLADTSNVFPDYDMLDPAFYASSTGGTISYVAANSTGTLGRYYLQLAGVSVAHQAESGWFPVDTLADYSVSGTAFLSGTSGGTAATLEIEFGSVTGAGTVTPLRRELVGTRTNSTSTARFTVNVTTAATERRARFIMSKSDGATQSGRFGGFMVRRRVDASQVVDGAITAAKLATGAIQASAITGQVQAAQIAGLEASKITGQLTDAQVAALDAAKLTGTVAEARLASLDATKLTGTINEARIAALAASKITGALTNAQIADLDAAKLSGTIAEARLASLDAAKLTGTINEARIAALAASKVTGTLTDAQLSAISAAKVTGQITDAQIAAVAAAKITGTLPPSTFPSELRPIEVVASLPASGNFAGRVVFLTSDSKLYRHTGSAWVSTVPAADITGTLADAQVAALAASKITGQLSDTQIADVAAAKLTGTVSNAQIAAEAITASKLLLSDTENVFPDFDLADPAMWSGAGSFNAVDNSNYGRFRLSLSASASAQTATSRWFPVGRGVSYVATFVLRSTGADAVCDLAIEWGSAAGTAAPVFISSSVLADGRNEDTNSRVAPVFFASPASAQVARLVLTRRAGGTGAAWFSGPIIRHRAGADLIVDGAVTAAKLATGAIQASAITGQVQAAQIAALEASKITGTLTNVQIADLDAAKLSGTIAEARLATLDAAKLTGTINEARITALAASKVTGQLSDAQIAVVAAAKVTGQLSDAQIAGVAASKVAGALAASNFPATLRPVEVVAALPNTGNFQGRVVLLTTDNKIYRWTSATTTGTTHWTTATAAADVTGTLQDAQITAVAASKITGQLTNTQIADLDAAKLSGTVAEARLASLDAAKLTGTINEARIAALAASKITGTLTNTQIAALDAAKLTGTIAEARLASLDAAKLTGTIAEARLASIAASKVTGTLTDAQLAAISAAKVTGQITGTQITDGAITTPKIGAGAVVTASLAAGAVTADTIAAGAIIAAKVAAGAIETAALAAGAITADKIAAGAITAGKIAALSITSAELAAGAVIASKVSAGAIETAALAASAITADKIAANAITTPKIAAGAVEAAQIAAGAVVADKIAAGAVTAGKIAALSITAAELAADSITAVKIQAGAVVAGKLAVDAVVASNIAAGAITTPKIAAGAVEAAQIAAGAVVAGKIAALSITAGEIAANAITADKVAANAITAGKIAAGAIAADQIQANAITASKISILDPTNLVMNPNFMVGTTPSADGWGVTAGITAPYAASLAPPGSPMPQVARLEIGTGVRDLTVNGSAFFPVTPGETFFVDYWVARGEDADAPNANMAFGMRIQSASGAPSPNAFLALGMVPGAAAGWTRVTGHYTVPATVGGEPVVSGRFFYRVSGTASPQGSYYVTAVKIRRSANAEMIVDGAVIASKVAAGAIEAGKIAAGAVTTAALAAGAVTADTIAANAITTPKISAGAVEAAQIATGAVTADKILAGAVTAGKIAALSITAAELAAGAVIASKVSAGAIETAALAAGAITADKIAANAITAAKIEAGAVTTAKIAAGAIEAGNIAAGAVTAGKIAALSITAAELAANAISADKIAAEAVVAGKLAANAVVADNIAAGAITTVKLAAGAVTADTIGAGAITTAKLAASAVTADQIGANAITAVKIAAGAVETAKIAAGAVTANEIAANTITAAKIAALTITSAELAADSVVAGKVAAGAIAAAQIQADAVTATAIAANAVVAAKIAAGAIETAKIAAGAITADKIAANAITAAKIEAGAVTTAALAAGSITASKLVLADTSNLFPDFDMEDAALYASSTGGAITFGTTTQGGWGRRYLVLTGAGVAHQAETAWFPVEVNADYLLEGLMRLSGTTGGTTATLEVEFGTMSASGVVTPTRRVLIGARTDSTSNARVAVTALTANNERRARFVMSKSAGATQAAWFAAFIVRRRNSTALIVDGAITASKLVLADTSNIYPDYDMLDPAFYASSTGGALSFATHSVGYLGRYYLNLAGVSVAHQAESGWFPVDSSADYAVEGAPWLSGTSGGTTATLEIEFGSVTSLGVVTPLRRVLVGTRTNSNTSTRFAINVTTAATERRARFIMSKSDGATQSGRFGGLMVRRRANAELIVDGAITAAKVAAGAIETAKLAAGAVTADQIGANAITAVKISAGAVETAKIAAGAVTADTIAAGAITTAKIQALAITSAELAAGSIIASKVAAGAIETAALAASAVTADKVAANAITAVKIEAGAVVAAKIAAGAVEADKIAAGAVTAGKIAALSITAAELAANSISADKIVSGAVIADKIGANAIVADKIASDAVTAAKILAGAVTTDKLAASAVVADKIAAGTIAASKLILADTSNLFPDHDMLDAGFYASSTGTNLTFVESSVGTLGRRFLQMPSSSAATVAESAWFPVDAGAELSVSGAAFQSGSASGTTSTLEIEFGSVTGAGVVTPTRRVLVGARTNSTSTALFTVDAVVAATERRARFVMTKSAVLGMSARFGGFLVRRRANAELIVDGAVIASKVATNAIETAKIAAGAVVADKIAANAITAEKISAGAIETAKIAAGAVQADKIAAGSILASKLFLSDTSNVFPDFDMLDPAFYSPASAFTHSLVSSSSGATGRFLVNIPFDASTRSVVSGWFHVEQSTPYRIDAHARRQGGTTGTAQVRIEWWTGNASADPAGLAFISDTLIYSNSSTSTSARGGVNVTSPGNARRARIVFSGVGGGDADVRLGAVVMRRTASAELIVDGAVIAAKVAASAIETAALAASAVVADKIAANAITTPKIEAGAITTAKLAAGAVTASEISSGAITTGKLAVAPPSGNVIWNSCLPYNRAGWGIGGPTTPTGWGAVGNGLDLADNNWRLVSRGSGGIWRSGVIAAGSYMDMYWLGTEGAFFSAQTQDGEWWEWQAHVQTHRCTVEMKIAWYNSAGTYLSEAVVASVAPMSPATGNALPAYTLAWGKAQAPASARRALAFFRVVGLTGPNSATGTDPYLFFTQALLARSHANQTEPSPWGPGGVTEINGGMLRTRSITANEIATGTLTANEIAAGAITAGKLAANAVTAGTVAAGAISTAELAAGAVNASKLAATELITLSAQIGNLTVNRFKIAGDGVSQGYYGISGGHYYTAHRPGTWNHVGAASLAAVSMTVNSDFDNGAVFLTFNWGTKITLAPTGPDSAADNWGFIDSFWDDAADIRATMSTVTALVATRVAPNGKRFFVGFVTNFGSSLDGVWQQSATFVNFLGAGTHTFEIWAVNGGSAPWSQMTMTNLRASIGILKVMR